MTTQINRQMHKNHTVAEAAEMFNIGSIVNQALIDVLIDKKIISAEELINYIGKIRQDDENMMHSIS